MKCVFLFLFSFIFTLPTFSQSQQDVSPDEVENILKLLANQTSSGADVSATQETLLMYLQSPVDLNKADREALHGLYILTDVEIDALLQYRTQQGDLLSIYELQAIPDWTIERIRLILPFIKVSRDVTKNILPDLRLASKTFILRYDQPFYKVRGIEEGVYKGNENAWCARLRIQQSRNFSFGIVCEQDKGEQWKWDEPKKQYGFDFVSAHVSIENRGIVKQLIIGDFTALFGQGLVYGAGFYLGKGIEPVTTVRRAGIGLKPYASTIEGGFFRGAGITLQKQRFTWTSLVSKRFADASAFSDTTDNGASISSLLYSAGYHRSVTELSRRANLGILDIGNNLTYASSGQRFQFGLSHIYSQTDYKIQPDVQAYKQFDFSGNQNQVLGLNASWYYRNCNFFSEAAISDSNGKGLILGGIFSLSQKLDLALVYRNYERNFHSFYGNAFAEQARNMNEKGFYVGVKYLFSHKLTFSAWLDRFMMPWLSYTASAPSSGYQYQLTVIYFFNKKTHVNFCYRFEQKEKNVSDQILPIIAAYKKPGFFVDFDYKFDKHIFLRSRIQWTAYDYQSLRSKGMAIAQEIEYKTRYVNVTGRVVVFDTDDYNSRIYLYEPDVLNSFSMPAYYGSGVRSVLLIKLSLHKSVQAWLRFSHTQMNHASTIGSGWDLIRGNEKMDLRLQLRFTCQ